MRPLRKLLPGPVGTSCLTCKRRHKKCDRQKPVCERCLQGGYECLGYDHNKGDETIHEGPSSSDGIRLTRTSSSNSSSPRHSNMSSPPSSNGADFPRKDASSTWREGLEGKDTGSNPRARGIEGAAADEVVPASATCTPQSDIPDPLTLYGADALIHDTFPPTRPKNSASTTGLGSPLTSDSTISRQHIFFSSPLLSILDSQIPRSISLPSDIQEVARYVKSHFDRMLGIMYFKPRQEHIDMFLRVAMWRLSICSFARRSMLIDAKVTTSILEGTDSVYCHSLTRLIDEFEQAVCARLAQPLTTYELQERLNDMLDTFFLKNSLLGASNTYRLLCRAVPSFLQKVYSDPRLRPTEGNSALISIAHLLASPRFGPAYFMLMDVMSSMVYGIPQLVGYDTDIEPFHRELHPLEWINCFPGEFQIILAKINNYRDQGPLGGDWRDIEQRIFLWSSRAKFEPQGLEPWKSIAWMAVQETWRQTSLIYLYLAVCGVPTDDPRVQSSLRQLFQLMGVIRRQDPPMANVHLLAQCLIAGICSHTERRRRIVRERLMCAAETRFWIFRGPEIVPILEHLWRGAAVGGQAVTWNDYLNSRGIVLRLAHIN